MKHKGTPQPEASIEESDDRRRFCLWNLWHGARNHRRLRLRRGATPRVLRSANVQNGRDVYRFDLDSRSRRPG